MGIFAVVSAIIAAVTAAASTAMQISVANKQAKAQADAAEANLEQQLKQEQENQRQVNKKSQAEKTERQRQALREQAMVRVSAGEAGIYGSVTSMRSEIDAWQNYGYDASLLEQNRENSIQQSEYMMDAYTTQAEGVGKQAAASYTGTGMALGSIALAGAGGGASGYAAGSSVKSSKLGVD
jgi:ribosomal protein L9